MAYLGNFLKRLNIKYLPMKKKLYDKKKSNSRHRNTIL